MSLMLDDNLPVNSEPSAKRSRLLALKLKFIAYRSNVRWPVFCFVVGLSMGAWIDVNGLWCELPLMVNVLPEGWKLPSFLAVSIQIAQIAPILFLLGKWKYPRAFTYERAIYFILSIGCLSCLLLVFLWNRTVDIFGAKRSLSLFILNFMLAFVDGTSSITFLPYISGNFAKEYIIPNYMGESLAALVPSILGLIQGIGKEMPCSNFTDPATNQTQLYPEPLTPNYSVSVYFMFMFLILVASGTSFTFLNFSTIAKMSRKPNAISNEPAPAKDESSKSSSDGESPTTSREAIFKKQDASLANVEIGVENSKAEKIVLYSLTFIISFVCYGVLPSIQTYSAIPYSTQTYYLSINLSLALLPIAIFLSIFSYNVSLTQIVAEFVLALAASVYVIIVATQSPCPYLVDQWLGKLLIIVAWIIVQSVFMRSKCLIAARLQRFGQSYITGFGMLIMIGQLFGGILIFLLVNVYGLFKEKPLCVDDYSYCFPK